MGQSATDTVRYLIEQCANIKNNEKVLLIHDNETESFLLPFQKIIKEYTPWLQTSVIPTANNHGIEPPKTVADYMLQADLTIGLTKYSLAHTNARFAAYRNHRRYLSLAGYDAELLENPALMCDYKSTAPEVRMYAEALTHASRVVVSSKTGTNISMDITNRIGNYCPGLVDEDCLLGSPPDVEANIAILENGSHGVIVADGSITHEKIGLLKGLMRISVEGGKIVGIESENSLQADLFKEILNSYNDDAVKILAELGIGFNKKAQLCGNMLVDEGACGCIHFGFGANHTIGGNNKVNFHIDCVVRNVTLLLDNTVMILEGAFVKWKL